MNKWPKHIEDCLKASIEHGPDAEFVCDEVWRDASIYQVLANMEYAWKLVPLRKPDIEQWGNEYPQSALQSTIYWRTNLAACSESRRHNCIAIHHRIIAGETGKTKFFETMEVLK